MKPIILLLALLLPFLALAQQFNSGFMVGFAATQVDGDGHGGFNKVGPIAGVWVSRNFGYKVFARFELRYIQKGSFAKTEQDGVTFSYYRMRLNYFEMPLLIGYRFVNGFNAIAGISGGYLASAKEMDHSGSFPEEDIAEFRKVETAIIAGLEYNFSERWTFGATFSYSLYPIRKHTGHISYRLDRGQYNQIVSVFARFKL